MAIWCCIGVLVRHVARDQRDGDTRRFFPNVVERRKSIRRAVAAIVFLGAGAASAHDFWIEPTTFTPAAGSEVGLRLYVGEHFRGDALVYLPELHERYVYVDRGRTHAVTGVPGDEPAGAIRPRGPGTVVVGYRSAAFNVTFDTLAEFERYLAAEGLEHIGALRRRLGKPERGITERYSRAAKALLNVAPAGGGDRRLGFTLELVAERNPYALAPGAELPLRLYYNERPLAGALVSAFTKDAPQIKQKLRTDRDGRVRLAPTRPGVWLVTAVHMVPAAPPAEDDWDSIWASLTFALPPAR